MYEREVNMEHFSLDQSASNEGRKAPLSGGFELHIDDGFFIVAQVNLNNIFTCPVLHERLLSVPFWSDTDEKIAPFPAGQYREKAKQKGSGDMPLQVQKIGRFCGSKEAGFWACVMTQAVLASLLHSP